MSEKALKVVGTRPVRHDGVDKVTGRANYGADFTLPGMLWGAFLRSPHAHAKILSVDVSAALATPGVKSVVTSADIGEIPSKIKEIGESPTDFRDLAANCLARGRVLYQGHAVAAVAATTREIAKEAAAKIIVKYEPLPAVFDVDAALAKNAPILHPHAKPAGKKPLPEGPTNMLTRHFFQRGDVAKGFADSAVVIEREFRTPMVHQGYIEPHACVARSGEDGQVFVWCSTQGPFAVRTMCAEVLGLKPTQIKVQPSEIGGGFGAKTTVYLEPVAILLSKKAGGRPVKLVMSREEVFRATGPTSGSKMRVKIGARQDGTLVAADVQLTFEAGAFKGSPVGAAAMCALACYRVENFSIEGLDVVVNKPKTAAYRAPGSPIANFAVESVVDELARQLRMDPIQLRLKNAVVEGDQAPYGPKFPRIGLVETLKAAQEHPHWKAPLGRNQGRGVGCGFWFNVGMNSSAQISVNEDGGVSVVTGNPDIGGTRTTIAMMVAEELGIPLDQVRPSVADTESVGYTDLTGGSRVTYATGFAAIEAARDVRKQLIARAAKVWNVPVESVTWEDGQAVSQDPKNTSMPMAVLARKLAGTGGPINARAAVNLPAAGPAYATHICDVEVDPELGTTTILRYTAIQDAGKAVHPSYVEGQMQGGAMQGIGWALNEEFLFTKDGVLDNASFLDYRMPVASDLPMIDAVIVEVPNPLHPYGVRGVGEVPIVPPLATVANAMRGATGVRFTELPMSPPRVLEGIEAASADRRQAA